VNLIEHNLSEIVEFRHSVVFKRYLGKWKWKE